MLKNQNAWFLVFLCLAFSPVLSADWIKGNFVTTFTATTADPTCSQQTRSSFSGPGGGVIDFGNFYFPSGGTPYSANLTFSYCNTSGSALTGGAFDVDGGMNGSFSGTFYGDFGNFSTLVGQFTEVGEYTIQSETGIFANIDPNGFFDFNNPNSGTNVTVLLLTPEPAMFAFVGMALAFLAFALRARTQQGKHGCRDYSFASKTYPEPRAVRISFIENGSSTLLRSRRT